MSDPYEDDGEVWTHDTVQRWLKDHAKFTREHIVELERRMPNLPPEYQHAASLYIIRMRGVAKLLELPLPTSGDSQQGSKT